MPWQIDSQPNDALLRSLLNKHRAWAVYALGDLRPPFRERTTFLTASQGDKWALLLIYRTTTFNAVIPFGPASGIKALLEAASADLPSSCIISNITADNEPVIKEWFALTRSEGRIRLSLTADDFKPYQDRDGTKCELLTGKNIGEMSAFYTMNNVPTFSPDQVQHGIYCGIRRHGVLVAIGGTHLVNRVDHQAALGNVYTDPILRGNGYVRAIISTLISAIFEQGIQDVVLDVNKDDFAARQIYDPFGFEQVMAFSESAAVRIQRSKKQ